MKTTKVTTLAIMFLTCACIAGQANAESLTEKVRGAAANVGYGAEHAGEKALHGAEYAGKAIERDAEDAAEATARAFMKGWHFLGGSINKLGKGAVKDAHKLSAKAGSLYAKLVKMAEGSNDEETQDVLAQAQFVAQSAAEAHRTAVVSHATLMSAHRVTSDIAAKG